MEVSSGDLLGLSGIAVVVFLWWRWRGNDDDDDDSKPSADSRPEEDWGDRIGAFIVAPWQWLWRSDDSDDDLEKVSPREFEQLIARLYEQMGYRVELTKQSRDGGVDLYARRQHEVGTEELAIECKHYRKHTVGVAPARALYGVLTAQPQLTRAVIVTSGSFSPDCQKFVASKRIDLMDGEQLRRLAKKHDLA